MTKTYRAKQSSQTICMVYHSACSYALSLVLVTIFLCLVISANPEARGAILPHSAAIRSQKSCVWEVAR